MFHAQDPFDDDPAAAGLGTDIAIVGMACRFPGAKDIDAYWRNLRGGVESVRAYSDEELAAAGVPPHLIADPLYVKAGAPLADMEMFDPALFGLTPREAAIMDPQHRHFLECANEALENAGHSVERFSGPIGVFGGSGHNAYMPYNLLTNPDLVRSAGFFLIRHTGNDKDFLTTRVSYLLDLKGPSMAVQTACSTSLVAVHAAVQSLLNRECDMALAGGVTIELPHRHGYLYEEGGILSPDGHCRPFDHGSSGTVFGSGVGIVVLRRLHDAIEGGDHIYAVIKGSAVNNDGSGKVGYLAPSVDGQANVIVEALAVADVAAETVSYVEAHGTGTPVGDPIEVAALAQAFRRSTEETGFCGIGSVKGNIGHTDTAAGIAGLIKVALALHHGELPPSLNCAVPATACDFDRSPFRVNDTLKPWPSLPGAPRRAGVSSLGVGGTNAHVVLEEAPARPPSVPAPGPHLLVLSAASETALGANALALADHLAADPALDLGEVALTLQVGRKHYAHRRAIVVEDGADAIAALRGESGENGERARQVAAGQAPNGDRSVSFLFAGGGAQHPNMGRGLYLAEPVFREAMDACLDLLERHCGLDVRTSLYPDPGAEAAAAAALERPSIGLPALFAMQYAQAKLWMAWGVLPRGMIGHSMGEYVAAHLAGVFTLADVLRLVHLRGRLFETVPAGAMLSVPMAADELAPLIAPTLSIAAINGPRATVVSGPSDAIAALRAELEGLETPAALLHISVAAHSAMLDPILAPFRDFLRGVAMAVPTLPFVSGLSGGWITAAQATSADYWVRHLRETVRFDDGLAQLLKDESCVLLEVGPGRTLASLARLHPARAAGQPVLNSSPHPTEPVPDRAHLLGVVGWLWLAGVPMMFGLMQAPGKRLRVPLPTYRFDHQRYWIEPGAGAGAGMAAVAEPDETAKRPDVANWLYRPAWRRAEAPGPAPTAAAAPTLLFADDSGIAQLIERRVRAAGGTAVTVRIGRRFARPDAATFVINPARSADYDRLLTTLAAEALLPERICHLWSVTGPASANTLRAAEEAQQRGFHSLLNLAQAIAREDIATPIMLAVVSDGMQRLGGEGALAPAKATVLGPCKVIPQEFANIRTRSIDIVLPQRGSRRERLLADALLAELDSADEAEVVALRGPDRWVQGYEPILPPLGTPPAPAIRGGGTYLVTGGLGDLGLAVARHLAATPAVRIVLFARHGLPPRSGWIALLAGAEAHGRDAGRVKQVLAIEKAGAEVVIVTGDVTEPADVNRAVKVARGRTGRIDGVFHTAGTLADGLIQLKDAAGAAATLAPKVRGTLLLHAALADDQPDFLLLFSSISAMAGAAGQVDYAAANAFLDAFAQAAGAADDGNVIAVDWSQWQEIGMAAALARGALPGGGGGGAAGGATPGTPVAHPLIDRCIRDQPDARGYATLFSPERHWVLDQHRVAGGQALIPGTGFLEIARAAIALRPESGVIELRDVLFLAPFLVNDGEERELQTRLTRDGDGAWKFELASADGGGSGVVHVRGLGRFTSAVETDRLPVAAIRARCGGRTLRPSPATHMRFGPQWDNVVGIDYGADEALIELAMAEPPPPDMAALGIHPALFDMATAGAQALLPGFDETRDFFIPASYDRIRLHRPLAGRLFSHVRLRRDAGGADIAVYDVVLADAAGLVLAEIREFTMIRLHDRALLARTGREREGASARPRLAAGDLLDRMHRTGILPAEGMAVIDRILGLPLGPQVIVSPIDFNAFMKKARAPLAPVRPAGSVLHDATEAAAVAMTPAERTIAALWGEVLGVTAIGPDDDFFDLGGHSLLAVQFVNKLRRRTGTMLSATALIEAPTVAGLAALIDPAGAMGAGGPGAAAAAGDTLAGGGAAVARFGEEAVRIGGDGGPPVFLVHDGLGEILLYRTLALRLVANHSIYGLQPTLRADGSVVHTRIDQMAEAHLAKIRRVQPHGPYLLAGLCAGGVIAFEMAAQLRAAGEAVLFVGIIDAADVEARERPFYASRARLDRFLGLLRPERGGEGGAGYWLSEAAPRMFAKACNWIRYEVDHRIERALAWRNVQRLRDRTAGEAGAEAGGTAAAGPKPAPMTYLDVYRIAHREHRPRGLFSGGDVTLFRATTGTGAEDDTPFFRQYSDCALGWGRRVAGDVDIVAVPGGHLSVLQEPNVAVLARALQDAIDRALARATDRVRAEPPERVPRNMQPAEMIGT